MIDPILQQQLSDFANQQIAFRMSNYQSAKSSGQEGPASQNLQMAQQIQSDLGNILSNVDKYNIGSAQLPMLQKALTGAGGPADVQAYNEYIANQQQLYSQNQQLQQYQNQYQQQVFGTAGSGQSPLGQTTTGAPSQSPTGTNATASPTGGSTIASGAVSPMSSAPANSTLAQNQIPTQSGGINLNTALSDTTGELGQLNQFMQGQENQTFNTQLKPLVQMALGAQGLSDSGAQVELQSKALANIDQMRQQNMMQAALGAESNLQGLQQSALGSSIGAQQNALSNSFDLQRAQITMNYQQQLQQQQMQLAQQLSQYNGGSSVLGGILSGGAQGAMIGGQFGGHWGALAGGVLGAAGGGYNASQQPTYMNRGNSNGFFNR